MRCFCILFILFTACHVSSVPLYNGSALAPRRRLSVTQSGTSTYFDISMSDGSSIPVGTYPLGTQLYFDRSQAWTIQYESAPTSFPQSRPVWWQLQIESPNEPAHNPSAWQGLVGHTTYHLPFDPGYGEFEVEFHMGYDWFHLDPKPNNHYWRQRHQGSDHTDFTFTIPALQDCPVDIQSWAQPDIFPAASSVICTNDDGSACSATEGQYSFGTDTNDIQFYGTQLVISIEALRHLRITILPHPPSPPLPPPSPPPFNQIYLVGDASMTVAALAFDDPGATSAVADTIVAEYVDQASGSSVSLATMSATPGTYDVTYSFEPNVDVAVFPKGDWNTANWAPYSRDYVHNFNWQKWESWRANYHNWPLQEDFNFWNPWRVDIVSTPSTYSGAVFGMGHSYLIGTGSHGNNKLWQVRVEWSGPGVLYILIEYGKPYSIQSFSMYLKLTLPAGVEQTISIIHDGTGFGGFSFVNDDGESFTIQQVLQHTDFLSSNYQWSNGCHGNTPVTTNVNLHVEQCVAQPGNIQQCCGLEYPTNNPAPDTSTWTWVDASVLQNTSDPHQSLDELAVGGTIMGFPSNTITDNGPLSVTLSVYPPPSVTSTPVSYTHLTLPTNREV